jgi:hypothetical protein
MAETVQDTKRRQNEKHPAPYGSFAHCTSSGSVVGMAEAPQVLKVLSQRVGESGVTPGVTPFAAKRRISSKFDYGKEGSAHGQAEETRYGQVHPEEESRQKGREKGRWLERCGPRCLEVQSYDYLGEPNRNHQKLQPHRAGDGE